MTATRFAKIPAIQNVTACIAPKKDRKIPLSHCEQTDKRRHKLENQYAKIQDRRRIAMRHDRCGHALMSAIYIAATVNFRQCVLSLDRASVLCITSL